MYVYIYYLHILVSFGVSYSIGIIITGLLILFDLVRIDHFNYVCFICILNVVVLINSQIASEGLKHRVFEVSLADLQKDEDQAYRKIRLRAEDVQGKNVLTNFWVW